jgi:predicted ferric reductase
VGPHDGGIHLAAGVGASAPSTADTSAAVDGRAGQPERDRTTVLTLRPSGHDGLQFQPGQFAWITVGRSPFSITSHPFSFCSSAETNGSVEVAIKAAGDFSSSVATVEPGTEVYVDGPHGVFSIDQYEGAGFCLIAGGVGIAPALSMLETLADRGDVRPVVLFAGNREWDSIISATASTS